MEGWRSVEELMGWGFAQAPVVMANEAHRSLARFIWAPEMGVRMIRAAHEAGVPSGARYIRRTVRSVLGEVKIRKLGADSLDALYTVPKKCCQLSIGSRGSSTMRMAGADREARLTGQAQQPHSTRDSSGSSKADRRWIVGLRKAKAALAGPG